MIRNKKEKICVVCGAKLRSGNKGSVCSPCQEKKRREEMWPESRATARLLGQCGSQQSEVSDEAISLIAASIS